MIICVPCLYTKQKTKKRKSWNDGTLKINRSSGGCRLFDNLDGRKVSVTMLESKNLRGDELAIALRGEECEIEFETYLVTIDAVEMTSSGAASKACKVVGHAPQLKEQAQAQGSISQAKGLALAPFKAPSKVARSSSSQDHEETGVVAKFMESSQKSSNFSKRYESTATVVAKRADLGGAAASSSASFAAALGGGKYQVEDQELDELWEGEEEGSDGENEGVGGTSSSANTDEEAKKQKETEVDNEIEAEGADRNVANDSWTFSGKRDSGLEDADDLWKDENMKPHNPAYDEGATSTVAPTEDMWSF